MSAEFKEEIAADKEQAKELRRAARKEKMQENLRNGGLVLPEQFTGTLAFTPVLLKSSLFTQRSKGTREIFTTYHEVAAYGNTKIEYKGEELRQGDLSVLLALIRIGAGKTTEQSIKITPRTFARDVLGWPDGSESDKKLRASVLRLQDARARLHHSTGILALSFISDANLDASGWILHLSPALVPLLTGCERTFMKASERFGMSDGLTPWLYGFIKSDSCMLAFDMQKLRAASGSVYAKNENTAYVTKEFNRAVSKTLQRFKEDGIITNFKIAQGKLNIRKA